MRHSRPVLALALAGFLACATATPAVAGPAGLHGKVAVFVTELTPLTVFDDPSGCVRLPLAAHVVTNLTDGPIVLYGDPFCTAPTEPFAELKPGYGSHVSAAGSFRA